MGTGSGGGSATMPSLQPMPGISQDPKRVPTNAAQQIGTPGNPVLQPFASMQWGGYAPWLMAPQWGTSAYGFQQPQQPINQTPLMWSQAINQLPGKSGPPPSGMPSIPSVSPSSVLQGHTASTFGGGTPLYYQPNTSASWQTGNPGPSGPAQYIQGLNELPNDPLAYWANNVNVAGMHQGIDIPKGILGNLGGVNQNMLGVYL